MRPLHFRKEKFSPYILTSVHQEAMLEVRLEVSTTVSTALLLSKVSRPALFPFYFSSITLLNVFDSPVEGLIQSGFLL